jgi:hypothetical protein
VAVAGSGGGRKAERSSHISRVGHPAPDTAVHPTAARILPSHKYPAAPLDGHEALLPPALAPLPCPGDPAARVPVPSGPEFETARAAPLSGTSPTSFAYSSLNFASRWEASSSRRAASRTYGSARPLLAAAGAASSVLPATPARPVAEVVASLGGARAVFSLAASRAATSAAAAAGSYTFVFRSVSTTAYDTSLEYFLCMTESVATLSKGECSQVRAGSLAVKDRTGLVSRASCTAQHGWQALSLAAAPGLAYPDDVAHDAGLGLVPSLQAVGGANAKQADDSLRPGAPGHALHAVRDRMIRSWRVLCS